MFEGAAKRSSKFLEDSSFIRHYLWKYRRWVGIGLSALILVDILEIIPPIFLKYVVDIVVEHRPLRLLAWVAGAYLAISIIQGICRYLWRMFLIRASVYSGKDLRGQYAGHLFGLSLSFFDRRRLGSLMSLAVSDVEAVRTALGNGMLVFADALIYLLTVPVVMFFLSPKLTLLACLPLPLIPIIVLRNEKKIHERFERAQECFGRISAITQENLNGIRVVKAFAREDTQIERIREVGAEYMRLNLELARIQSFIGPMMDFVMSVGMFVLLFVGGSAMIRDVRGAITLGTFVAFQRYIQKMVWPMAAVGMAINFYQRAVSSSGRLKEIFAITTDVPNPAVIVRPTKKEGRVEFRNLSFNFPGTDSTALRHINLMIEPSERVAFVGTVGSGKSAILSLLPRLYPIQRGMLWIDGVDVNDWSIEELRKQVGYVSQDVFLFSETVMENVAFGLHEWAEQPSSIEQAARLASVHEEIISFASSYRTQLGERGINLSGGQKQRLTIARALAKQPNILVLDDALSSVDLQTEEKILQGLRTRPGRNTEMIAAHRISTIKGADRIIVLQDGNIVQMGTHNQLVTARSGNYFRFFEHQRLKEDLENYENEL
jgi:ATP-binding cassette subfamily B multidrug efflux pump